MNYDEAPAHAGRRRSGEDRTSTRESIGENDVFEFTYSKGRRDDGVILFPDTRQSASLRRKNYSREFTCAFLSLLSVHFIVSLFFLTRYLVFNNLLIFPILDSPDENNIGHSLSIVILN